MMKVFKPILLGLRPTMDRLRYELRTVALRYARSRPPVVIACAPAPDRLGIIEQWSRVADVLAEAQTKAVTIVVCQKEAAAQLDAATYALQRLRAEMAPAFMSAGVPLARTAPASAKEFRQPFRRREPVAA